MDKSKQLQDIIKAISDYHEGDGNTIATLFITGNTEMQKALTEYKGNAIVLAQTFGNQMENHPDFNQLMKALMSSYLSQHPKEKDEFIRGLEITNITPSMN